MSKFIEEREKLLGNFSLCLNKSRSTDTSQRTFWKGIETTQVNLLKFNKLKEHLAVDSHPLNKIIASFQKWMVTAYNFLLYPSSLEIKFEKVREELVDNIHRFIALMFFTTIKFYNLNFKDNENNTDILLEILTERVVKGKLYMALYNIISYCHQKEIKRLNQRMTIEENVDFENSRFIVGVSEIFSFSEEVRRNRVLGKTQSAPTRMNEPLSGFVQKEQAGEQYSKCIKMIWNLKNIENPTDKIQLLVKVVNQIKQEIDEFWTGVDITQDEKCIDADNLEKLLSYVIIKSKYQKIVVDLQLIDLFSGNHIDFGQNGYIFANFSSTINHILFDEEEEKSEPVLKYEACKTPCFKAKESVKDKNSLDSIESEEGEELANKKIKNRSLINLSQMSSEYSPLAPRDVMHLSKSIRIEIH